MIPLVSFLLLVTLQAAEPPTVQTRRVADSDLMAAVRTLAEQLAELRGEALPRPPVALRAGAELRRVVTEVSARSLLPAERLAARGRAWSDIGLGRDDAPGRLLRLLAADLDGVACDPVSAQILVEPGRLSPTDFAGEGDEGPSALLASTGVRPDEPVLMHALVHLLQRQRGDGPAALTTDTLLADTAWREGEANVVAMRYLFRSLGIADENHFIRPLARRGFSSEGLEVGPGTLVPELTATINGIYWHPLASPSSKDMLVTRQLFPLSAAVTCVQKNLAAQPDGIQELMEFA